MSKRKEIQGTVHYHLIATGFWGITDDQGKQWRPVEMPHQLRREGARIRCVIKPVDEEMSIFMWGTPVEIITFYT